MDFAFCVPGLKAIGVCLKGLVQLFLGLGELATELQALCGVTPEFAIREGNRADEVLALIEEEGTQLRPMGFGSTTAMTVRWNDGDVLTEVQIPMLASGQRIVVEHTPKETGVETIPATRFVPPPPTAAPSPSFAPSRTA